MRIFSGVQPSGNLHIGNYLGAIKQFVELQRENEAIFCVVDMHAITVSQNPKELYKNTLSVAALYLAAGINPKKSTVFVQSHVPAHSELAWILTTFTPLGELERMTQFKDKSKSQAKKNGIFAGLFSYPVLMAADILLYQTDSVPVGEDQIQHVEFTRTLAERFNNKFGKTFRIPKEMLNKSTARIMALDDPAKKMSKSAESAANYIALLDSPDDIRKKIKNAVTDSGKEVIYDPEKKPAISNLISVYSEFSGMNANDVEARYSGKGYGDFKKDLGELLVEKLSPIQTRHTELMKDESSLRSILRDGAERASIVANKTLTDVKEKIGFVA